MADIPQLSIITTCKGRLAHLRETLPTFIAQADTEVIVVDYHCPESCGNWVSHHHPTAKVVRVSDDNGFCAARARNRGAQIATGQHLAFVDADIRLSTSFAQQISELQAPNRYLISEPSVIDVYGTVALPRERFFALGCYDEVFRAWGGEDEELYLRLNSSGMQRMHFPATLLAPIPHDDTLRMQFRDGATRSASHRASVLYITAKHDLMRLAPQALTPQLRESLFATAMQAVSATNGEGQTKMSVEMLVPFPNIETFGLRLKRNLTYQLEPNL